jgi:ProP effector
MLKPNTPRTRRKSYEAMLLLVEKFPAAFSEAGERRPLKIGLANDLLARGINRQVTARGLHSYCNAYRYLVALQDGAVRIGLDGEPAGVVTADEAANAQQRLAKKAPKPERAAKASAPKPTPKTEAATEPLPREPRQAPPLRKHKPRQAYEVVVVRRRPGRKPAAVPGRSALRQHGTD